MATMDKATEGLNRTSHAIQASAEIIDVLGRRADDIGKIIEVIDDLAEQTNLLALNAAIEAARAGEHGLGFAVVAEEVRKLAEKSTQSTKEISELIQGIQKEAREAVENMDKSTSMVQEGLVLNKDLSLALDKISDVVSEVYKFSQEIGAATMEQSSGSAQIAKATNRLTEITQEINSSVEEQASGAQAVVRSMERMRELVQQSTSSSTELAAAAEQMSKLSRNLLESMDRFALEESVLRSPALRAGAASSDGAPRAAGIRGNGSVLKTRTPPWTRNSRSSAFGSGAKRSDCRLPWCAKSFACRKSRRFPTRRTTSRASSTCADGLFPSWICASASAKRRSSRTRTNRIVVVELETRSDRPAGQFRVRSACGFRRPKSKSRTTCFKEGELNYITGVGKLKGRLVILLDLNRILQRGELAAPRRSRGIRSRQFPWAAPDARF